MQMKGGDKAGYVCILAWTWVVLINRIISSLNVFLPVFVSFWPQAWAVLPFTYCRKDLFMQSLHAAGFESKWAIEGGGGVLLVILNQEVIQYQLHNALVIN